jgi:hypothetical protein
MAKGGMYLGRITPEGPNILLDKYQCLALVQKTYV